MVSLLDKTAKGLLDSDDIKYKYSISSLSSLFKSFGLHRKRSKLDIVSVSKIIGVDQRTLSDFESGKLRIDQEKIMMLCDLYGLNKDRVSDSLSMSKDNVSTPR